MLILKVTWLFFTIFAAVLFLVFGVSFHSAHRPNLGWIEMVVSSYVMVMICGVWIWGSVQVMNWVFGG